jgi:hypothetical protein
LLVYSSIRLCFHRIDYVLVRRQVSCKLEINGEFCSLRFFSLTHILVFLIMIFRMFMHPWRHQEIVSRKERERDRQTDRVRERERERERQERRGGDLIDFSFSHCFYLFVNLTRFSSSLRHTNTNLTLKNSPSLPCSLACSFSIFSVAHCYVLAIMILEQIERHFDVYTRMT